jgi:hypothetical protein
MTGDMEAELANERAEMLAEEFDVLKMNRAGKKLSRMLSLDEDLLVLHCNHAGGQKQ